MDNIKGILNVTDYGVKGDGKTNNTAAIAKVIDIAEQNGGGTIYFPPGEYVTGTIELKDNMTLYIDGGAVILGSENPEDYPMITKEDIKGYTREGHSGLIKALRRENVTITGRGIIDGRGQNWWKNPKNEHRPRAIQPILCKNVVIRDVTVRNSAMWTVHPLCCDLVTIDGIMIKNPSDSPNTDGINPESCRNVHISNCKVDVGDDCVTIKSGTEDDELQKQYPCENIVITNCTMLNGHGGVVIGSEMSGGVKNVAISNCVFSGTDRGIRIKTRRKRGGCVEDVIVSNIIMDKVLVPFVINGYYQCGGASPDDMSLFSLEKNPISDDTPVIKNISILNVNARNVTASAGYIYGIPEQPVDGLTISNYNVEMVKVDGELKDKPIMAFHAPYTKGEGIYFANTKNLVMRDVCLSIIHGIGLVLENSSDAKIYGLRTSGDYQAYALNNTTGVQVNE